jgi:hypothetical protein
MTSIAPVLSFRGNIPRPTDQPPLSEAVNNRSQFSVLAHIP